jgi:hypothetical protein
LTIGAKEDSRAVLLADLREVLSETTLSSRDREARLLTQIGERPEMPIVLFGAGRLGRRTLSILRAHGLDVAAFTDNEPRTWGSVVDDVPVLSPSDAAARFSADGLAVVTIWRGEGGHDFLATRDDLRRQGWRQVESFIALYWGLGGQALPYFTIDRPTRVLEARDNVLAAAELWSDQRSLREYVDQVHWRLSGDFAALGDAEGFFSDAIVFMRCDKSGEMTCDSCAASRAGIRGKDAAKHGGPVAHQAQPPGAQRLAQPTGPEEAHAAVHIPGGIRGLGLVDHEPAATPPSPLSRTQPGAAFWSSSDAQTLRSRSLPRSST